MNKTKEQLEMDLVKAKNHIQKLERELKRQANTINELTDAMRLYKIELQKCSHDFATDTAEYEPPF